MMSGFSTAMADQPLIVQGRMDPPLIEKDNLKIVSFDFEGKMNPGPEGDHLTVFDLHI